MVMIARDCKLVVGRDVNEDSDNGNGCGCIRNWYEPHVKIVVEKP